MYAFLTATPNLPFSVALGVMAVLLLVEMAAFVTGLGLSDFLDHLLPDIADADGAEVAGGGIFAQLAGWLLLGRVPALILLAIFLSVFGVIGLGLQGVLHARAGFMLPWWLAPLLVAPLSLPFVRVIGLAVARVLPRDESEVASRRSLLGHVGVIVLGRAAHGSPAQAKVRDEVGQTQYVMVEPEHADEFFDAGEAVLLKSQRGAHFGVVRPDPALLP